MFDNLRNLSSLLKNAPELKRRAEELQAELERKTVEGEAGGGAVRVTMNGKMRVLRVDLDKPLLSGLTTGDDDDKIMVEELIAAATNHAVEKVQELISQQMREATGGLNIPGMENMLGGQ